MSRLTWMVFRNRLSFLTKKINFKNFCTSASKTETDTLKQQTSEINKLDIKRLNDFVKQKAKINKLKSDQLMHDTDELNEYFFRFYTSHEVLLREKANILSAVKRVFDIMDQRKSASKTETDILKQQTSKINKFEGDQLMDDKQQPDDKHYNLLKSPELLEGILQTILAIRRVFDIINPKKFEGDQLMDDKHYLIKSPELLQETYQALLALKRINDIVKQAKKNKFKSDQRMDDKYYYNVLLSPETLKETYRTMLVVKRAADIFQIVHNGVSEKETE